MNQKKPQRKTRLVQVIGLYILCLLAAFCTWMAVMYAEDKAQKGAKEADESAPSFSFLVDETSASAGQGTTVAL